MTRGLTRRQFLRRLGIATGATLGLPLLADVRAMAQSPRRLHVVIVGAGMAGLCAALELERGGHRCTILEAETAHVGGRVRTLRFEDGIYAEAGAMRIPTDHRITRQYVAELGLSLRPFVQGNADAYYFARGRRARIREVGQVAELYALAGSEHGATPDSLWARGVGQPLAALTPEERQDLSATALATDAVRALDQLSLVQLLEKGGLSAEAVEFLATTYGVESVLQVAATEHLREERDGLWVNGFDEIVGGTDRLPAALAAKLRSRPRLGAEVVRLEQDGSGRRAAAIYRDGREGGRLRRAEGDFLLCTLPFSVLGRLQVAPAFSPDKQRAIRELGYDSSTKVLAIAAKRFWETEDGIYGGGTFTDLPTGTTWYPSDNATAKDPRVSARPAAMLASYTWGAPARRLAALPHRERAALVLEHLARVHPQLARPGAVRRTASWSWDNHRWSAGAFASFAPGQHTALHRHIGTPEGRIHFAGEHVSLAHSWIQGALESALVAVREMLARA